MAKILVTEGLPVGDRAAVWLESARKHSRWITVGVVTVLTLGALGWFWRSAAEKKEINASRALAGAQRSFGSGNLPLAQSDLQALIRRYQGTGAEVQGRILLAQVLFSQQKVEEGLQVLREGRPSTVTASGYYSILAAGLEQSGKPAEAAAEYVRSAEAALSDPERESILAEAARAFEAAGNLDEARRIWGGLAADESKPIAAEAKLRLGELTAKAVTKG